MIELTSKDVFEKRKLGEIDEAYEMAKSLIKHDANDEWNIKALAWCLIELIKRSAKLGNKEKCRLYFNELNILNISQDDDVLQQNLKYVSKMLNPNYSLIQDAKSHSKNGKHSEAIDIYLKVLHDDPSNMDIRVSIGWELYNLAKPLKGNTNDEVIEIKKILTRYLKLNTPRPSLLHSAFLIVAKKIIEKDSFNVVKFLKMWGIENLRDDDFENKRSQETGNIYSSIAETVIKKAVKQAIREKDTCFLNKAYPYLDKLICIAEEPVWLELYKSRLMLILGKNEEAYSLAVKIVKSKIKDFWAWDLLGDTQLGVDKEIALSCYCKALSVSLNEKFIPKIRLKLAELLIEMKNYSEAKYEIEKIIENKLNEGYKIPEEIERYTEEEWYRHSEPSKNNHIFYKKYEEQADSLLFKDLPWIYACLGDKFYTKDNANKPKRQIYLNLNNKSFPIETFVPEKSLQLKDKNIGAGIRVKGEANNRGFFQIYYISERQYDQPWDIFEENIAIIDHVNNEKHLLHVIVDKDVDTVIQFNDLDAKYNTGDCIAVMLAQINSGSTKKYRAVKCNKTDKKAKNSILKEFSDRIEITEMGFGFTHDNIFIEASLIRQHAINDGDLLNGLAVLNYNKKRRKWCWKALKIYTARK